jgi:23S rRNA (guanosine2251-2'-O)-methyltransferase
MNNFFEIRVCLNIECGLRYPLMENHPFGTRCPHCLGETRVVLKTEISEWEETRVEAEKSKRKMIAVLVDNIRSAWNVGSILRSADGFGFTHAYLCGITPTPENEAVTKTSLGAEDFVTWSYHKDAVKLVKGLKKTGWKVLALEEHERAKSIASQTGNLDINTVLMIGNEITGVDPELLELADEIYFIPMRGQKRSFNVANAFSIAAYALVDQTL